MVALLLALTTTACFKYEERIEIDRCHMTEITFCGSNECKNDDEYTEKMKRDVLGLDIEVAIYQLRSCTFKRVQKCAIEGKTEEI